MSSHENQNQQEKYQRDKIIISSFIQSFWLDQIDQIKLVNANNEGIHL